MTEERIWALESVSFDSGTIKTDLASIWGERFQQLREYKVEFGDCLVPCRYSVNHKLGHWVSNQHSNCRLYLEGKPSPMTAERFYDLENVGLEVGNSKTAIWSVRFQQLREFKVQFGHLLVPQQYAANHELGRWVSKQRHNCKLYLEGKPSAMSAERIRQLESVEFKESVLNPNWSEILILGASNHDGEWYARCNKVLYIRTESQFIEQGRIYYKNQYL